MSAYFQAPWWRWVLLCVHKIWLEKLQRVGVKNKSGLPLFRTPLLSHILSKISQRMPVGVNSIPNLIVKTIAPKNPCRCVRVELLEQVLVVSSPRMWELVSSCKSTRERLSPGNLTGSTKYFCVSRPGAVLTSFSPKFSLKSPKVSLPGSLGRWYSTDISCFAKKLNIICSLQSCLWQERICGPAQLYCWGSL